MKKIIAVMCAGILCLSLAACGNNNAGSDAPQEQKQAQSSENTSEEASAQVDDTQSKSTERDSEMRVATYGLKHNEYYSDFINTVTLDDLFV